MTELNVAVVVPRRDDHGRRDELWAWCRNRWVVEHPDFQIAEGVHEEGPFNRSAAINAAVSLAPEADVYIIADSDSYVDSPQLLGAIDLAMDTGMMTFAHNEWRYLGKPMTDRILAGWNGCWDSGVEIVMPLTQSSMVVVPGDLWRRFGGADEGFVGWGGEDIALAISLSAFGGGLQRQAGPVWHLWHPGAVDGDQQAWTGRLARYSAVSGDPEAVVALVAELRSELSQS